MKTYDWGQYDDSAVLQSEILFLSPPARMNVEPIEIDEGNRKGVWKCDPKYISILVLNGKSLPVKSHVFYDAKEISWTAAPGTEPITQACPGNLNGGFFQRVKLHGLVFGLYNKYIGCRNNFVIENTTGPVWVAVNDSNYTDNGGHYIVQVAWR